MQLSCCKGILLYTDEGIKLLGIKSNGKNWTIEECFTYCNLKSNLFDNIVRSNKLKIKAILFNDSIKTNKDWFTNIDNFKTVDIFAKY
jgi:hypothetical protein